MQDTIWNNAMGYGEGLYELATINNIKNIVNGTVKILDEALNFATSRIGDVKITSNRTITEANSKVNSIMIQVRE